MGRGGDADPATGDRDLAGQSAEDAIAPALKARRPNAINGRPGAANAADWSATAPVHFYPERTVASVPGKRQATGGTRPTVSV